MTRNRLWMVVFTAAALGLAACGGDADADGSDAMDETAAAAEEMADDADGAMDGMEEMAEDAEGAADAAGQELPEGVTMAMVQEGEGIYNGAGICASCHGPDGAGIPNLGANLSDAEWLHSDGSYEAIVQTVIDGVTAEESSSGIPMPPKAGTNISDAQVRAAAAYVWTLSK